MTNLEGINKGDRVKIETSAGDTAEFTVVHKDRWVIESATNTYGLSDLKSLEVVQKSLPTEPGLYKAENGESRVFILKSSGEWVIYYTTNHSLIERSDVFVATWFRKFTRIEL